MARLVFLCLLLALLPRAAGAASLTDGAFIADDGTALPLRHWDAPQPRAIVLALHGMNDYSNAFDSAAKAWAGQGITTYAYDQRGFGAGPDAGHWAGGDALRADFCAAAAALHERFAALPLFAVGESMGGAVILTALTGRCTPPLAGVVLESPAVWARSQMPLSYRVALFLGAHLFPGMEVTGSGLHILASDNIPMLRALSADPLVIKATRIDAIAGLSDLMDEALVAPAGLENPPPLLILRGDKDPIIPAPPSEVLIAALTEKFGDKVKVMRYADGYHMLTRDLDGPQVAGDVAAWILATGQTGTK